MGISSLLLLFEMQVLLRLLFSPPELGCLSEWRKDIQQLIMGCLAPVNAFQHILHTYGSEDIMEEGVGRLLGVRGQSWHVCYKTVSSIYDGNHMCAPGNRNIMVS